MKPTQPNSEPRARKGRTYRLVTAGAEETTTWGARVGRVLPPGAVIALEGDLGAGKTTLSRGLCEGLGVEDLENVVSPTFTLLNEYEGREKVAHFDFYRLDSITSLPELGFDEALASGATVLVEWAEKFPSALPSARTVTVRLTPSTEDPDRREIEVILPAQAESDAAWDALRKVLGEL